MVQIHYDEKTDVYYTTINGVDSWDYYKLQNKTNIDMTILKQLTEQGGILIPANNITPEQVIQIQHTEDIYLIETSWGDKYVHVVKGKTDKIFLDWVSKIIINCEV